MSYWLGFETKCTRTCCASRGTHWRLLTMLTPLAAPAVVFLLQERIKSLKVEGSYSFTLGVRFTRRIVRGIVSKLSRETRATLPTYKYVGQMLTNGRCQCLNTITVPTDKHEARLHSDNKASFVETPPIVHHEAHSGPPRHCGPCLRCARR